jgi:hypothetical protein
MEIFNRATPGSLVLDFGANAGWFSVIAASFGHRVVAFEAEGENVKLLARNASQNGYAHLITPVHVWIGVHTPQLPGDREDVEFLKMDIECHEDDGMRMCAKLFESRRVRYALVEISPCCGNGAYYPDLVEWLGACGYDMFDMPDKLNAYRDDYSHDPLAAIRRRQVQPGTVRQYLAPVHQTNMFFVRKD